MGIDDFSLTATTSGAAPTLTATPTTLSGLTYVEGSGPSASQSYRLTGSNLPAGSTASITAPASYEVSQDNGIYGTSFTVSNFVATDVYVRLKGGLTAGTYNGEVIVNSGGGAPAVNVTLNGSVTASNPVPAISSISPSTAVAGSAGFTLTVNGTGFVTGSVVSFNGISRITVYESATRVTATISATDIATAGTYDVIVTNSAPGGGTSAAVPFTVTAPTPTLTATQSALSFSAQVGTTSVAQSYVLSGANLPASSAVIIRAPTSFQVSITSATSDFNTGQLVVTSTSGSLSQQVWVRFTAPATPGTSGPADVTNTLGSNSVAVVVTGTATAVPGIVRWDGGGDGSNFSDAQNWDTNSVPATGDEVLLDHSAVAGAYIVTLPAANTGTLSLSALEVNPGGGAPITVVLPSTNTAPGYLRFTKAAEALVLRSGATFINSSTAAAEAPVDIIPAGGKLLIFNGARYVHNSPRASADLMDNLDASIAGTEQGIVEYDVPSGSTTYALPLSNRVYGSLILRSTVLPAIRYTGSGNNALTVRGDLSVGANVTFTPTLNADISLGGNLLNSGVFRFLPASTTVRRQLILNGVAAQAISGNVLAEIDPASNSALGNTVDFVLNNSQGLTLSTGVRVNGDLILTAGVLTTSNTSLLTLRAGSTISGGSTSSFVSGPLAREAAGPGSLPFPIGKGTAYRPLTLNITTQASGTVTYTAEQQEGRAPIGALNPASGGLDVLTRVSRVRRYTVGSSDAAGFAGTVLLSFGADDQVNNPSSPTLVIGRNAGSGWDNIGRAGNTASEVSSGSFSVFGDFALASTDPDQTNNPLPVALLAFTAERQAQAVRASWATASEQNSAYFEVQRSATGREFCTIARVAGQGTTTRRHSYAFLDQEPLTGLTYYRLHQVDIDGSASFSPVVSVAASRELVLYPNPARTELHLAAPTTGATYRVLNLLGAVVLGGTAPNGTATLEVVQLPAGLYQLELTTAAGRVVRKFTKQE